MRNFRVLLSMFLFAVAVLSVNAQSSPRYFFCRALDGGIMDYDGIHHAQYITNIFTVNRDKSVQIDNIIPEVRAGFTDYFFDKFKRQIGNMSKERLHQYTSCDGYTRESDAEKMQRGYVNAEVSGFDGQPLTNRVINWQYGTTN